MANSCSSVRCQLQTQTGKVLMRKAFSTSVLVMKQWLRVKKAQHKRNTHENMVTDSLTLCKHHHRMAGLQVPKASLPRQNM